MTFTDVIRVTGIGAGYNVHVARGVLDTLGDRLRDATHASSAVVVTNDVVGPILLPRVVASLETAGVRPVVVTLPDGEGHKTLASLQAVYDAAFAAGIERRTPVIGLGGGVVTDLAGFAAATLLRGLPYVAVPTSLLAMVDASVGGKTGVNHAAGKNLVGAFHPARFVLIDPDTLATLPPDELAAGLAECVKHDVIRDAAHFKIMEREAASYTACDADTLARLVGHNVRVKASVVAQDPFEHGVRAHLNLGHTFGHAFEKATSYGIRHGHAVAVGTACACHVATHLGLMSTAEASRVVTLLHACGLPTSGVSADPQTVLDAMQADKKVQAGRVRFVLPVGIGDACVRDDVPPELVRDAVARAVA